MKKTHRTIHDALFKKLLQNLDTAKTFIQKNFPAHKTKNLDLDTLAPIDTTNTDNELNELHNDILFTCKTKENAKIFLIISIEHQSTPDKYMAYRLLRYKLQILSRYEQEAKFPNFLNIVLFHHKKPYPYSCSIFDCFQDPELAREDFFGPFDLVDVGVIPDAVILKNLDKDALLKFLLKHCREEDFIPQVMELMKLYPALFKLLTQEDLIAIFTYVLKTRNATETSPKKLLKVATKTLGRTKSKPIMSIAYQLKQEGKQEGLLLGIKKGEVKGKLKGKQEGLLLGIKKGEAKGKLKGKQEGLLETAKNMLALKLDINLIEKATGLPRKKIKELKQP